MPAFFFGCWQRNQRLYTLEIQRRGKPICYLSSVTQHGANWKANIIVSSVVFAKWWKMKLVIYAVSEDKPLRVLISFSQRVLVLKLLVFVRGRKRGSGGRRRKTPPTRTIGCVSVNPFKLETSRINLSRSSAWKAAKVKELCTSRSGRTPARWLSSRVVR